MNNVTIYLLLAFFAALILYFQIQKLTRKLDEEGAVPAYQKATQEVLENLSNAEKYPKFCNVIFKKIIAKSIYKNKVVIYNFGIKQVMIFYIYEKIYINLRTLQYIF